MSTYISKVLNRLKSIVQSLDIKLIDGYIYTLQFTDDQVVLSYDEEDM